MTYLLKRLLSKLREQKDIGVTTTEVRGNHGSKFLTMTPAEISAFHIVAREKKIAELEAQIKRVRELVEYYKAAPNPCHTEFDQGRQHGKNQIIIDVLAVLGEKYVDLDNDYSSEGTGR
jgi:hypothetical protein